MTIFPSQQALELAGELFAETAKMAAGYEGRMGKTWYWRMPGKILVGFRLAQTGAQERWDVIQGEAATVEAGVFAQVDFPFIAYARSTISAPYLREIHGEAQWIHAPTGFPPTPGGGWFRRMLRREALLQFPIRAIRGWFFAQVL